MNANGKLRDKVARIEEGRRARAAVRRLRQIHQPLKHATDVCRECGVLLPCPTLQILDGEW